MYTRPDWIEVQGGMLPADVRAKAMRGPFPSYFEEHCANVDTPEWEVFQDEWGRDQFTPRHWRKMDTFMCPIEGVKTTRVTNANIVIAPSYAGFALWYANEWLKRGVSLYLDNSMLQACADPHKSAAYRKADGQIVPAVLLWSQREYYKRMWNLRCQSLGLSVRERGGRQAGPPPGKGSLGLRLRPARLPRAELLERRCGGAGSRWSALVGADLRDGPANPARASELDAKPGDARLVFDVRRLGFAPRGTIIDAETGQALGQAGATVVIPMNRPYATRVIVCAAGP